MDWNDPEQVKEYYRNYYQTNKEKWDEYRERRDPELHNKHNRDYAHRHPDRIAERNKLYRPADYAQRKAKRKGPQGDAVRDYHTYWLRTNGMHVRILNALGPKCSRCGFEDIRALQIDHKNGGGTQERKQFKNGYQYEKYIFEHLDSGKYQVLCSNCNLIKRDEMQENRWNKRE